MFLVLFLLVLLVYHCLMFLRLFLPVYHGLMLFWLLRLAYQVTMVYCSWGYWLLLVYHGLMFLGLYLLACHGLMFLRLLLAFYHCQLYFWCYSFWSIMVYFVLGFISQPFSHRSQPNSEPAFCIKTLTLWYSLCTKNCPLPRKTNYWQKVAIKQQACSTTRLINTIFAQWTSYRTVCGPNDVTIYL